MKLRLLVLGLAGALALVAAGCGDDTKSSDNGSASDNGSGAAKALTDVPPRTSKPNIVGGSAAIEEFAQRAANDATSYWDSVFTKSNISYVKPTTTVAAQTADNGCGAQFDPAVKPFFLCETGNGGTITLGGPVLDQIRTANGDGAVVFMTGFAVALDANDQLSGHPLAKTGQVDDAFMGTAACFTGAWIRNLADRNVLEAGDDAEVLDAAGKALGKGDVTVPQAQVKQGYSNGVGSCQTGSQGGGGTDTEAQPAPSPSE